MKKVPAIILLTLGNLAAVFIVTILVFLLWWNTLELGLAIFAGFAVLMVLGFVSSLIYNKFKKKYGLKPSRFILAAYVPSVAGSAISALVILILDNFHFFSEFLGGLRAFLTSLFSSAAAVLYLIFGACFTLGSTKEKDNTKG